jgi:hypothetical protein
VPVVGGVVSAPSEHAFVRSLRRALVEDARADVMLALRAHVLAGRGHGQIAARLGAATAAVHCTVQAGEPDGLRAQGWHA